MAGSIRSSSDDDMAEAHEINVTPFIDVMLVLLIIFMVAAPLSTVDVPVNLPNAAAPPTERPDEPIIVSLQPDLTLSLGNGVVARETLAARLLAASGNKPDTRIFLRADTTVSYGALMDVMTLLRDGGFTQVALVGLEAAP
ncbi:TonB system transport protein ExbD [Gemmobacter fulvus]|uniref:Biopolymer transport protein ExbD n=1 Tax=Gemmobacter fulvus TaxID=2840474 RepID=A0A975S0V9_9RHOB|nr:TonB system transport protein ExbD [Gemmobacter fulvus]MBT9245733.1 TonB system transport protein ExbD [Gemmobacter fulvus]QWK89420.1 TonB system transport protein ExbD [Gemmobacter fulvus]